MVSEILIQINMAFLLAAGNYQKQHLLFAACSSKYQKHTHIKIL